MYIAWSDVPNIHPLQDFPVALSPGHLIKKKIVFVVTGSIPSTPGQDFFRFFFRCNFSETEGRYI